MTTDLVKPKSTASEADALTTRPSELLITRILLYAEAATDHELYYHYYIIMDELLNPGTDEKLVLCVCNL